MTESTPRHASVLIVDDDEVHRYALARLIRDSGFEVVEASTGKQALDLVKGRPDAMILDVHLPDIDGFEVCRRVKEDPATASVLVLQSSAVFVDGGDRVRGLDGGADAYLAQPVNPQEILATLRSLMRLRQYERERDLLLARTQRAVEARDDLLSIVSHDLRNPLGTILMSTTLLRRAFPEGSDTNVSRLIERIERSAGRMETLIRDLLDVTAIESGQLAVHKEKEDLAALVRELHESFELDAQKKRLHIALEAPRSLVIEIDKARLTQVISNIVQNAMKFTPEGGHIQIILEARANGAKLTVRDTGPGIDAQDVSRIFDRRWRAKRDPYTEGMGLGLFITKGIVVAHGGTISVETALGKGAAFIIELG